MKFIFLALYIFSISTFYGCFSTPNAVTKRELSLPTKDEVARVNGRPLTLTTFISIKNHLKDASNQKALWLGTAALAIQGESQSKGKELSFRAAFELAEYAMNEIPAIQAASSIQEFYSSNKLFQFPSPHIVKSDIDALMERAIIQKGLQPLSLIY